jgi:hypothetical protein
MCWVDQVSFKQWAAAWARRAIYEEEGWPHDPLNRAIILALLYAGFPLILIGSFVFFVTRWDRIFPIWLSFPLVAYAFVVGWAILDERRSRRRSESGGGHGWIWQMIQQFRPRRRINQAFLGIVLLAHVFGALLVYIDRFTARDLERADATRVVEAGVIIAVDLWLLAITLAWLRTLGPEANFWPALKIPLVALLVLNALMSVGDGPWPWIILPTLVALLIAVPGWLLHAIWRWRHRTGSIYAIDSDPEPAGLPGWW